ncbi:MAG: arginine--tRNA ligase [Kiritimatiellaeota bacterium]|nr:arginine--tRNA ligase [Kiritimatiellota bacterium]
MQDESLTPTRKTLEETLTDIFAAAFTAAFPDCPQAADAGRVSASANPEFGDFQCNGAMALAKNLKMPPRAVAEKIVEILRAPNSQLSTLNSQFSIAGPGFINITLADGFVAERAEFVARDEFNGIPQSGAGQKIVVDYSSPNVAKPMHIGHIRSTIIGAAIDKLHRALGYDVLSDNHIGDWGTQFGIIIMGYRNFVDQAALADAPATELERVYVQSYARAKDDDSWMDQCRAELVKLQRGDPENLALWREFIRLSLSEFDRVYKRLGIEFAMTRGESFYNEKLPGVVARLEAAGLAKESDGATIVDLSDENLGVAIVRKSDGGFNYTTTDIATVDSRVTEFAPAKIVYVTDERQQLHFKQFFTICRKVGIAPDSVELTHVWFGLMRLPEGTFSTRQGNVIKLEALLDEAEARAFAVIKESRPEMPEEQARPLARQIGIGAVKYADLSQDPKTLITFSWDKALALDGNSGPYLQYAYARVRSVRAKYAEQFPSIDPDTFPLLINEKLERELALKIASFPAAVQRAALTFRPCVLADYLYDLAQTYSSFYQQLPFLKAEPGIRESRVKLCGMTSAVLSRGLSLLGIETPERI